MRAATILLPAAVLAAAVPGPTLAQIGNPGFMTPDTRFDSQGIPEPNQPNPNDTLFAQLAAESGLSEVTFGQLAVDRAARPAVRDFASRMVNDHSAANDQLAGLAKTGGIPLSDALNAEHQGELEHLQTLEGADFDLAYMQRQVAEHQKATTLLLWEIGSGQDGELQRFAAATLPTILEHLRMAQGIVADLSQERIAAAAPAPATEGESADLPAE